jgi:hypothetical protein
LGGTLRATEQPIDTSTAAGKCFLDMLGVFAEFETNLRRFERLNKQVPFILARKWSESSLGSANAKTGPAGVRRFLHAEASIISILTSALVRRFIVKHRSVDTLRGCVRDAEAFRDHAGAGLLKKNEAASAYRSNPAATATMQ